MRLSGACSNHRQLAVVRNAAEALLQLTIDEAQMSTAPIPRLRAGAIQEAAIEALVDAQKPLTPRDVRAKVESRLGRAVSLNTIGSFLSVACRSAKWHVRRSAPGEYETGDSGQPED